jgi:enoyl-CoA hydratase/carnithine racemase
LIRDIAEAYVSLDGQPGCRAIVLCSEGKHFCAGADFNAESSAEALPVEGAASLYREAVRLFRCELPVVACVQGAAIGGGLGLACSADFRVGAPEARFAANFSRLGFHHGFGLSVTLPAIVGGQRALELLYTGRRFGGEEAHRIGLFDRLAPLPELRAAARAMAAEIAASAPLAVRSIRQTMRGRLADAVAEATDREDAEQIRLRTTADFAEGVRASAERREPQFSGH